MARLVVLSGLPGAGKSTLAKALAVATGAVWLRIDSIEQAIRDAGVVPGPLDDAGYRAAQAAARDNLVLGRDVVADCVNGWTLTRDAWRATGLASGAEVLEVEVVCSDIEEHRRRVEARASDIAGLVLPDWNAVVGRDYHPWNRERLVVDTAGRTIDASVQTLIAALARPGAEPES